MTNCAPIQGRDSSVACKRGWAARGASVKSAVLHQYVDIYFKSLDEPEFFSEAHRRWKLKTIPLYTQMVFQAMIDTRTTDQRGKPSSAEVLVSFHRKLRNVITQKHRPTRAYELVVSCYRIPKTFPQELIATLPVFQCVIW